MPIALDHFFVLTAPAAPAASQLTALGLVEGKPNHHAGQGTANRRFFLANAAFEFLYLHDAEEARSGPARRLHFSQRLQHSSASPFGLVVRQQGELENSPFPGWKYCPQYFAANQCFHVGDNSKLLAEPLCICMPSNLPRPRIPQETENPRWKLTELRIDVPVSKPSQTLEAIADCAGIALRLGAPHHLEIILNDNEAGGLLELSQRPGVTLRW